MKLTKEASAAIKDKVKTYGWVRCAAMADLTVNTLRACASGKNITGQTAESVSRYLHVPLHHIVRSSYHN